MRFKEWLESRWYHGSHRDFEKYNREEATKVRGSRQSADSLGQWFTSSQKKARDYGSKVYEYEFEPKHPWIPPSEDFRNFFVIRDIASKYLTDKDLRDILYRGPEPREIDIVDKRYMDGEGTPAERRAWIRNIPKWRTLDRAKEKAFRKLIFTKQYLVDLRDWLLSQGYDSILWKDSHIDLRKDDSPHDVLVMLNSDLAHIAKYNENYIIETTQYPESRIELTCIMLPHNGDATDVQRTEETKAEWQKAKQIAKQFGIKDNFSFHSDRDAEYGDGYLYPSLAVLEHVLNNLDIANIGYDNIDLPKETPPELISRLQARYPRGKGVMVNLNQYP